MGKSVISIRPCSLSDCRFLWQLRNEKAVRESAFSMDPISYDSHAQWFNNKMNSKNSHIFVVLNGRKRIGQVRFDACGDRYTEVDISIKKEERGRGFGAKALGLACSCVRGRLDYKQIIAYVKKDNASSYKVFKKSCFLSDKSLVTKNGEKAYRMVLK